jgi:hypothetical protein
MCHIYTSFSAIVIIHCGSLASAVAILDCYCILFSAVDICRDYFASALYLEACSFISFTAVVLCRGSLSLCICVIVLYGM